ncbi:MAG: type II toxin-antitoxin system PemK/MazF family toxin [Gammaproteobacteria bacterium]|jgi:mRNA interferase MazF|nr:type II toxin-antitoxin system PemK/MazF family toxin [Xanthomonadales bacterium]
MVNYIPEKGDFVVLNFNPQSGHEQKGKRPALVISNQHFNQATGLAVVCPLTNTNRRIPFHLDVSQTTTLTGFIMVEQMKSVDYRARRAKFIEKADKYLLNDVLSIVDACIYQ